MLKRLLALLFATSVAVSAQASQPPTPGGSNGNRSPQTQGDNQSQQAGPVPPFSLPTHPINVSVNTASVAEAPRGHEGGNDGGSTADWWIVWITGIATVLAVIGATIAWNQFKTQRDQTIEALEYAKDGVNVSRIANEHALSEATKVEQRSRTEMILAYPPRLAIRNVSIPLMGPLAKGGKTKLSDLSDELTGEFLIANVGRNDAIIEAVYSQWIVGELPMTNPCHGAVGDLMTVTLRAGMSINVPARPGKISWGVPLEDGSISLELEDDLTAILGRQKPVYLVGFVAYRDTLGGFRQTFFCRVFDYRTARFKPVSDPDYNYKD